MTELEDELNDARAGPLPEQKCAPTDLTSMLSFWPAGAPPPGDGGGEALETARRAWARERDTLIRESAEALGALRQRVDTLEGTKTALEADHAASAAAAAELAADAAAERVRVDRDASARVAAAEAVARALREDLAVARRRAEEGSDAMAAALRARKVRGC